MEHPSDGVMLNNRTVRLTSQGRSPIVRVPNARNTAFHEEILMVSATAQTEARRDRNHSNGGRRRKKLAAKNGTPKFPIHLDGKPSSKTTKSG
ncbi:MAG: hypothetical protein HRU17_07600 [Polyangiaceae bacterium]|nr:hypothetical protein [Polyangiaceae bacterium]